MKTVESILIIAFGVIGLFSCKGEDENNVTGDIPVSYQIDSPGLQSEISNTFFFEGGLVELKQEDKHTIQQISTPVRDINYRAQKIPSELYLRNKGLEGTALTEALEEVAGEQLFYFEFEEQQKQDLIKKHLGENPDASISYLSFDIFNDFRLINEKGDTLESDYSLYERNFHVAPYERVIVSFSGVEQNEAVKLLYEDKLFGNGNLSFHFASSQYVKNNIKNPS